MLAIAGRELRSFFSSPLAWSLLAVQQLLLAWLFMLQLEGFLQLQPRLLALEAAPGVTALVVAPLLDSATKVLLLLVPLFSMNLFSRELRSGTIDLLLSAPVSITRIVLGKYLALLGVLAVQLILVATMPLSLLAGGELDRGTLAAGLLGLALTLALYGAVGMFLSSLSRQPSVAAAGSYGVLLLLWILGLTAEGDMGSLLSWLSLSNHFRHLLDGLVISSDLLYFLLLILACLLLTIHRLDGLRGRS